MEPCRVCGGSGVVAQKQFIDDGYGEVDSCPACALSPASGSAHVPERPETEDCGLSIDMLDADRLRAWADKVEAHGADISHWASCAFVVAELRRIADGVSRAVDDIGSLRKQAALSPASDARPKQGEEWEVVLGEEDDEWGVRRKGEDRGKSIAQMVWKGHAPLIASAPALKQRAEAAEAAHAALRQQLEQLTEEWKRLIAQDDKDDFGLERRSVRQDDLDDLLVLLATPAPEPQEDR